MSNSIVHEDLADIARRARGLESFDGATILITGCAGFLGYYLILFLARYAEALGIQRLVATDVFSHGIPKWLNEARMDCPSLEILQLDVADKSAVQMANVLQPTHIVHAASIASPTFYRKAPLATIDANVWGLRNMLDLARTSSELRGMLFFSSSEIYGDPAEWAIPTAETYNGNVSCSGPRACYDESKRMGETLCWAYAHEYSLPVTVVRPFNNFGPGLSPNDKRLPADLAHSVLRGKDIHLYSDGSPTRTFCYISDAVVGYLSALNLGKFDTFNIGNDAPEMSILDFAELFAQVAREMFGYHGSVKYAVNADEDYLTDNPQRRVPDITHARSTLGYEPQVFPRDGISRYLDSLRETVA